MAEKLTLRNTVARIKSLFGTDAATPPSLEDSDGLVVTERYTFKVVSNFKKDSLGVIHLPCDDISVFAVRNSETGVLSKSPSHFMHPFLSMVSFTEIIVEHFKNEQQSGSTWCSLFGEFMAAACDPNVHEPPRYKMELLSGISCSGIDVLNVPGFKIYCNDNVANHRRRDEDNQDFHQNFSFVEVRFDDDEIAVVRVMAIVRLYDSQQKKDQQTSDDIRLVVIKLSTRTESTKQSQLGYSWFKRNGPNREGPEIHTVTLESVVIPACVLPVFTKGHFKSDLSVEKFVHNQKGHYKLACFKHVRVHSICKFDLCNSFTEAEHEQRLVTIDDVPINLSDDQIEYIQNEVFPVDINEDDLEIEGHEECQMEEMDGEQLVRVSRQEYCPSDDEPDNSD